MGEIKIKYATEADLPFVYEMMGDIPEMDMPEYAELEDLFKQKKYPEILVAFNDAFDFPVGMAIFITYPSHTGKHEAFLFCLAVDEAYRRNGIGTALIKELKEIIKSRGADFLCFLAHSENDTALQFYEKIGAIEASGDYVQLAIPIEDEEAQSVD